MPHYKDSENKLSWLDAGIDPALWLTPDCIEISDEEAEKIRKAHEPVLTETDRILLAIEAVEASITPRMLRDAALGDTARLKLKEAELSKLRIQLEAAKNA